MTIGTVRAGTRADVSVAATTINVPYPSSPAAGELLIVVYGASAAPTVPAGWSGQDAADNTNRVAVLWKLAAGGESGSLAVTVPSQTGTAQMFAVPGVDATPLDVAAAVAVTPAAAAATLAVASGNAVTTGAVAFYAVSTAGAASTTFTGPGGSTELADWGQTGGNVRAAAVYRDTSGLTAGDAVSRTVTPSVSRRMAAVLLLLRPTTPVTGTGTLSASHATLSGAGSVTTTGTGAVAATPATLTGTGTVTLTGTGGLTAGHPTLSGAATVKVAAAGALSAAHSTISGSGVIRVLGSGSLTAGHPTISGAVVVRVLGTGALVASAAYLSGEADTSMPGSTTVRHYLVDAGVTPRFEVEVTFTLVEPLTLDGAEAYGSVTKYTDLAGFVEFTLIPGVYVVTWQGHAAEVTVPDTGGPHYLDDLNP